MTIVGAATGVLGADPAGVAAGRFPVSADMTSLAFLKSVGELGKKAARPLYGPRPLAI
jgi:hypothetical protein